MPQNSSRTETIRGIKCFGTVEHGHVHTGILAERRSVTVLPPQQTTMIMQAIRNWLNAENKFYSRLTEESVSNAWVIKFNAGCAVFFFLLMISETL